MEAYEVLEREVAEWSGMEHVVAASSGTAALHLALEVLSGSRPGQVVIPDYTMVACPRAAVMANLRPRFVDCGPDLLLSPEKLRNFASCEDGSTVGVMAVHIYGRACNMSAIHYYVAETAGWFVVEDMAEAHGVRPHPNTDAACWSFYQNKVVSGQEGGAVAFANPEHASLARQLRCLGFTERHDYSHLPRGWNHRLSNIHAKLILESLRAFQFCMEDRRRIEGLFDARCPAAWRQPARLSPWVYDVRIPGLSTDAQDRVVFELRKMGVPVRHGFKPMTGQPEFKDGIDGRLAEKFGPHEMESWRAAREVIYFPIEPGKTTAEVIDRGFTGIASVLGV